jgi:hypothetical protein
MRTFAAEAVREGRWWAVTVEGVGVTQGRSAAEAQRMAVDLASIMLELPEDEIEVTVSFTPPGELAAKVAAARAATAEAAEAQRYAAQLTRTVAAELVGEGLSSETRPECWAWPHTRSGSSLRSRRDLVALVAGVANTLAKLVNVFRAGYPLLDKTAVKADVVRQGHGAEYRHAGSDRRASRFVGRAANAEDVDSSTFWTGVSVLHG